MSIVEIALANIRPGRTRDETVTLARDAIGRAGAEHADVVCFPEAYVPGYRSPARRSLPPDAEFLEHAWTSIADAAKAATVGVVLGTERVVDDAVRISALVIDRDGGRLGFQDKIQLDPSEDATYAPGVGRHIFSIGDLTFGVVICHEGWRYPETVRWAACHGAQLVFHPHFHEPEPGGFRPAEFADSRNTFHEKAMLCRAAENTIYFASVNCAIAGSPSTSAIVDPDGTVRAWQPYGVEGVLVAELDLALATRTLAKRYRSRG